VGLLSQADGEPAMALNNLALIVYRLGNPKRALVHSQDSVAAYRERVKTRPHVVSEGLALALLNQGAILSALGRLGDAIIATQEAESLFRGEISRARALFNLGMFLEGARRTQEAMAVIEQAQAAFQRLAILHPGAYDTYLITTASKLRLLADHTRVPDRPVETHEPSRHSAIQDSDSGVSAEGNSPPHATTTPQPPASSSSEISPYARTWALVVVTVIATLLLAHLLME
jgi:tetratricopeptide (TPR) repeat protein